jgi:hypothetical protein
MAIRFGPKIRKKCEKDASSEGQSHVAEQQGQPQVQNKIIGRHGHGLEKSEHCCLSKEYDLSTDFIFGGTDNGIVTMTDTVSFNLDRYMLHLGLYHGYRPPEGCNVFNIPTSYKVKNGDVDMNSGNLRLRNQLNRKKKNNPYINQTEQELSKCTALEASANVSEFASTFEKFEARQYKRCFYQSPGRVRQKRHAVIQYYNYRKKLCSDERKFCINSKGKLDK